MIRAADEDREEWIRVCKRDEEIERKHKAMMEEFENSVDKE
jgi:hypothetical protein